MGVQRIFVVRDFDVWHNKEWAHVREHFDSFFGKEGKY
jgi:hypothetical protein